MVGKNRFASPAGDDFPKAAGDLDYRLIPGNPAEFAGAFRSAAAHRVEQAVGVIYASVEMRHLAADESGRYRIVLRAPDAGDAPFFDAHLERAGVRTIHRAGCLQRSHRNAS